MGFVGFPGLWLSRKHFDLAIIKDRRLEWMEPPIGTIA